MGLAATSPAMGEFFEDILGRLHRQSWRAAHGPGDLDPATPPEGLESEEDDDEDEGTYEDPSPSSADRRSPRPGEVP